VQLFHLLGERNAGAAHGHRGLLGEPGDQLQEDRPLGLEKSREAAAEVFQVVDGVNLAIARAAGHRAKST